MLLKLKVPIEIDGEIRTMSLTTTMERFSKETFKSLRMLSTMLRSFTYYEKLARKILNPGLTSWERAVYVESFMKCEQFIDEVEIYITKIRLVFALIQKQLVVERRKILTKKILKNKARKIKMMANKGK